MKTNAKTTYFLVSSYYLVLTTVKQKQGPLKISIFKHVFTINLKGQWYFSNFISNLLISHLD